MQKRIAADGLFLALALVVSYIEVLIPIPVGIPGVKNRAGKCRHYGTSVFFHMAADPFDFYCQNSSGGFCSETR